MSAITLPVPSLVVLIGASGSGKSTFARKHFRPTEIVSSDFCRALVSDDENNMRATPDAFELLHVIVAKRLAARRLTVVDATNARQRDRKPLVALARRHRVPAVAIVFDLPERTCLDRNLRRSERTLEADIIHRHWRNVQLALGTLAREGFERRYVLTSVRVVNETKCTRANVVPRANKFARPHY